MYSEQFIFNEVTTSCIKGITVILRKKFSEILKRVILQNPCQKSLCWIPSLINSQGWTLDLHFCWKEVSAKDKTSCDTSEYSALLQSGLTWPLVLVKLQAVRCRAAKRCYSINLRQLVFGTFSEKSLWWSLPIIYSRCAVYIPCRLATLLKQTPS